MNRFMPSKAVLSGDTADVYFARTLEILEKEGINPVATMEVFSNRNGFVFGSPIVLRIPLSPLLCIRSRQADRPSQPLRCLTACDHITEIVDVARLPVGRE